MKFLVLVFLLLSFSFADTHTATSAEYSACSTAIALSSARDTVIIPSDTATWTKTLTITKGIYLVGSGYNKTKIIVNTGNGISIGSGKYLIKYSPANYDLNTPFRLSGFYFDLNDSLGWLILGDANKTAPFTMQDSIRIDHNYIYRPKTQSAEMIFNTCTMYGVVDNNTFDSTYYPFKNDAQNGEYNWYKNSPQNIFTPGSSKSLYYEDNIIKMITSDNVCFEGQYSGRYVVRYNTITGAASSSLFELHGHQTDGAMGSCFGAEIYGNQITTSSPLVVFQTRGGKSFVYGNNVTTSSSVSNNAYASLITCPDTNAAEQVIHDNYLWNNRKNLSGARAITTIGSTLASCNGLSDIPTLGRDIFSDTIGSPGITSGTLANLPGTCSTGQGYWATNQSTSNLAGMVGANPSIPIVGALYKAVNTNTWESFYSPYKYPHPLRGVNKKCTITIVR